MSVTSTSPAPAASSLKKIPVVFENHCRRGEVAGAVTLVALDGKIQALDAVGYADLSEKRPMKTNDVFWVASMTKPITSAAILLLADEGMLSIEDPVEKHLPEFKDQWVVKDRSDDRIILGRPARRITVRDLLSHTSGLQEPPQPPAGSPLAAWVASAALLPLRVEPGSEWKYGSIGFNILGRIVEVVCGTPFQDFLRERFFDPLGMTETTFFPNAGQVGRLAKSYLQPSGGGVLTELPITSLNANPGSPRVTVHAGGGLFSTAGDMFRFYQMLLNSGEFEGRRYLKESTVRAMTRPQTGDLKAGFSEGMSWGLGVWVVREPQGVIDTFPTDSFGHDGAHGTSVIAVPSKSSLLIMMIQRKDRDLQIKPGFMEIRHGFVSTALEAAAEINLESMKL